MSTRHHPNSAAAAAQRVSEYLRVRSGMRVGEDYVHTIHPGTDLAIGLSVHDLIALVQGVRLGGLADNAVGWARDRKIIPNSTPTAQLLKAVEELGELAGAIARGNRQKAADGIGDVFVCLANVAALMGLSLTDCAQLAWDEIKDRKGFMNEAGVFVKEADLMAPAVAK